MTSYKSNQCTVWLSTAVVKEPWYSAESTVLESRKEKTTSSLLHTIRRLEWVPRALAPPISIKENMCLFVCRIITRFKLIAIYCAYKRANARREWLIAYLIVWRCGTCKVSQTCFLSMYRIVNVVLQLQFRTQE